MKGKKKFKYRRKKYEEEYGEEDLPLTEYCISILKIIIIIIILFCTNNFHKPKEKENNSEYKNSELYNDVEKKFKEGNDSEALKMIENSEVNDCKSFLLQAKMYYNTSEYYKSLKELEKCLNITNNNTYQNNNRKNINDKNIEIYQLLILNYIKMFDLEKAKEILQLLCQSKYKNQKLVKQLSLLIEEEEEKIKINTQKFNQYPKYINFMKVLYKKGLFANKIEISFVSESYRFCRATEDIQKKEFLFRLPLEGLISKDTARKSLIGPYFTPSLERKLNSPTHCLLTTFLLNETDKGNESEWKHYLDFLPSNYSTFPSFYGEREYNYLKGTYFLDILEEKKNKLKKDYDTLVQAIPGFSKYDFNYFKKMREVVGSRVFGISVRRKKETVLVPLADLLNHKRPVQTYWDFNDTLNAFYIKSLSTIQKGDEVFDSYGIKSNGVFLISYGFTVENNTDNKFRINLELKYDDNITYPFLEEKMSFLRKKLSSKQFLIGIKLGIEDTQNFFSFLRFILYKKANFRKVDRTKPISIENEIDLFTKVREIMTNYINRYPTTLDYDIDYLEKNKNVMDFNEYNCYVIRIGEKKILHFYLDMANDILEAIKSNNITQMSEYKQLFNLSKSSVFNESLNLNINNNNKTSNYYLSMKYKKYIFPYTFKANN